MTGRIGFSLSTCERPHLTTQCLAGLATAQGFDLIWVDGSAQGSMGRDLLLHRNGSTSSWRECPGLNIVERWLDVVGGPDAAIHLGLVRLLALGYDWCGLIENDVMLHPGWLKAIERAADDYGPKCGAVTPRGYCSRVFGISSAYLSYLSYRENGFAVCWAIGAGAVLFSRTAAQLILANYPPPGSVTSAKIRSYWRDTKLTDVASWEFDRNSVDRPLGADWSWAMLLDQYRMASIATVPAYAHDLEYDPREEMRTDYL